MLSGIHDRRGRWTDLDPSAEIARMGENVCLNRNESHELLRNLFDKDLVFTRFLRAGNALGAYKRKGRDA